MSILNRNTYSSVVGAVCTISVFSGNPSAFLAMANIMQYLMLFIFMYITYYPTLLLNFLTTNGIFGFDFIAPIFGIEP